MKSILLWLGLVLLSTAQAGPLRLLALDWAAAETAQALGVTPVGMAQLTDYRIWSGGMPMPDSVVNVGLRMEPNLELIARLKPDLILIAPIQQGLQPLLQRIAPVRVIEFNSYQQPDSYRQAQAATRQLAIWLDRQAEAEMLISRTGATLDALANQLGEDAPPLYLFRFADRRHLWLLGEHSLFGGALASVGIPVIPQPRSNLWGFTSVPLTALTGRAQAQLVYIEPLPFKDMNEMQDNQLWRQLPAVRAGRVIALPAVWLGNGLPSVERFASLLSHHWRSVEAGHGRE